MLIIFDCDGVLVDSEIIAAQVNAAMFAEAGYPITPEEVNVRFAGLPGLEIQKIIEEELGYGLPDDFKTRTDARSTAASPPSRRSRASTNCSTGSTMRAASVPTRPARG
ncbi:hypothetical protein [Methylobrevis pamukkalensis]|uniref:6-phosphogluconate phosphatase n=1 Tax=Methylobrevis pamukkalensis TaxID=1439726 RepID=A0A1E3GWX2_9HYPH|nr:6-phosphogluconate phosphatase [Methylobrevis pamukkalensis]